MEKNKFKLTFLCENTLTGYTLGAHCNHIDVGWSQNVSLPISISHYVKTI
jgi:hypothetical protein